MDDLTYYFTKCLCVSLFLATFFLLVSPYRSWGLIVLSRRTAVQFIPLFILTVYMVAEFTSHTDVSHLASDTSTCSGGACPDAVNRLYHISRDVTGSQMGNLLCLYPEMDSCATQIRERVNTKSTENVLTHPLSRIDRNNTLLYTPVHPKGLFRYGTTFRRPWLWIPLRKSFSRG